MSHEMITTAILKDHSLAQFYLMLRQDDKKDFDKLLIQDKNLTWGS
jgi:hypothetical protein